MNYEELYNLLKHHQDQNTVFIPNEIFEDFVKCDLFKSQRKATHMAFAYSFYYLTSYLYYQCKYEECKLTTPRIKQILGYNGDTKTVDYIIKQGGLLDLLGYTESTTNYPIYRYRDEDNNVRFYTFNDLKEEHWEDIKHMFKNKRNFKIKRPLKAFYRDDESRVENHQNGTFFITDNTTIVPFDVFLDCMSNDEIGVTGFYLYSYIKYMGERKNGKGGYFNMPLPDFAEAVGFSESTLVRVLTTLESYKMITNSHEPFVPDRPADKEMMANAYSALPRLMFAEKKRKKIPKRRVMSNKSHDDLLKRRAEVAERIENDPTPFDMMAI